MPSIMRNAQIDSETMGFGLTISTFMTVAAMVLGGTVARFASNRTVLLGIIPCFAVLLFAYLTAQSPLWFYVAIIPLGLAFGLTDVFMNAEASAIEHDLRRPVFTAFHAGVSIGVAVIAVVASFLSTMAGTWATGLLMACFSPSPGSRLPVAWRIARWLRARARMMNIPNKRPLVLLGIAAGLIIAGETAALLWSAKLLDELAPALAAIAGLGAAFYGLCNASLRLPGDKLRRAFGDLPLMIASLILSIAGFAALGLTSSFAASVVAFAAVGLGTALLIPCIFAMAAAYVPANRAGGISFVSLLTALPRILAPWAFGIAAGELGISFAFGLVAIGLGAALTLILILQATRRTA